MSRSPQIPEGAIILRTHAELDAEADAFFADHYDLVLVVGPPGTGKSFTFKSRARRHPLRCHYIEGNTKPLSGIVPSSSPSSPSSKDSLIEYASCAPKHDSVYVISGLTLHASP